MRVTSVRVAVLGALGNARTAMTAQELVDALGGAAGGVDRVTVYRTLNSLVEAGVAHKVDPGDRVFRFGLTAPASATEAGHQHPHFVCDACGNVECLEDTEVIVQARGGAKPGKAKQKKMRLSSKDVLLHGTCEGCGDEPARGRRGRPGAGGR
jgi:Fur family ferric uptake transcriptional regulator